MSLLRVVPHELAVTGGEVADAIPFLIGAGVLLVAGGSLAVLGRARPWRRRAHARK